MFSTFINCGVKRKDANALSRVGYQRSSLVVKLPNIRDCVFDVSLPFRGTGFESDAALAYARDYEVGRDAWVVWRNLFGKSL